MPRHNGLRSGLLQRLMRDGQVECSDKDCLAICKNGAKKPELNCDSNSNCACKSC
ncbi:MAG: hypothetical protein VB934_09185 [Polyangiaceae bacterium]